MTCVIAGQIESSVSARRPGFLAMRTTALRLVDGPLTNHYLVTLVVTRRDGARLQTSKDSFSILGMTSTNVLNLGF